MLRSRLTAAFTLIELLVVVAIIALLIAILLPSLKRARDTAEDVACRMNQRQIGVAFFMFANDHNQTLPGQFWGDGWNWCLHSPTWANPFFGTEMSPRLNPELHWIHTGTLAPYIGLDIPVGQVIAHSYTNLYRCPGEPEGKLGSGIGSNGMFDYSAIGVFAGAAVSAVPSTSQVRDPDTGQLITTSTPILLDEDPAWGINTINIEMTHAATDRMGTWHPDHSGNYVSIDGSVTHLTFSIAGQGPSAYDWSGRAPSGNILGYSSYIPHVTYGQWNHL